MFTTMALDIPTVMPTSYRTNVCCLR